MPSVDDLLRQAFEPTDPEWVRRAPSAHRELRSRHRRHQLVRRSAAGALVAAALVVAVTVVDGEPRARTVEPADPTPTSTAPAGATPLEGTWISEPLDSADVRASARAAGSPAAATAMLDELPDGSFRVVMLVRGSSLRTSVRSAGTEDVLMDEEVISTTGRDLVLSTLFGNPSSSVHRWTVQGDRLTMTFERTTEGVTAGVPGEAWHRLFYDTVAFTR